MKKYLLGIDIGTSSVKALLCSEDGEIVVQALRSNHLSSPHSGWAEESPSEWWQNTKAVIRECLTGFNGSPSDISGIGVTGMVPAVVLLDDKGEVIRQSIQQNDARTVEEIDELKNKLDFDWFFKITGSMLSQQSVAPKLKWLQKNEPINWAKVKSILGSYDYINYCLTGMINVEANWALESGLFDIQKNEWSESLIKLVGINKEILPPVRLSHEVIGEVSSSVAVETGLAEGTLVIAGSADHVAAALAAGIKENGDLLVKFGSAGDILYSSDNLVLDNRLFLDYHDIPGKYLLNGCMATSGSLLKWYVKQFCQEDQQVAINQGLDVYDFLNKKAEQIAPGCDGIIVLPYFLGEKTPIFDPAAKGVFWGLTLFHTRHHLYRAVMEAVCFGFRHHLEVLIEKELPVMRVVASEGGAKSYLWRQITADVLNKPVVYLKQNPGAAFGAAFIAGIAAGVWSDWDEINQFILIDNVTTPISKNIKVYERSFSLYLDLYLKLKDLFKLSVVATDNFTNQI